MTTSVIPKGYKILWLAHTHHLLDQAFIEFGNSLGKIPEPKPTLSARVVSGMPGHHKVHRIAPTDDIVVATLQTMTKAHHAKHPSLLGFLEASEGKLCVVFDEAHHSPAPSYRKLLKSLRSDHSEMILIGLTATPTHADERKQGWLKELFPQGIIHQSQAGTLIAAGILSRPNFEKNPTEFTPDFDQSSYKKWVDTYQDLPEHIIESLAKNEKRNALIANHYLNNRERFGRTIIFAERWYQCEQIETFLRKNGVKCGSIYHYVDSSSRSTATRAAAENRKTLEAYKRGELEVLINVKMLTEGTDVPMTQTVFITRQTTSSVLLTQMVGRALRGPKIGGTGEAFIVCFEDRWEQKINWAEFDQPVAGTIEEEDVARRKAQPMSLISVDLVRRLTEQMDSGVNITGSEFLKLLPIGWYKVEFQAVVEGMDDEGLDDVEGVTRLIMVFDDQVDGFRRLLKHLLGSDLGSLNAADAKERDAEPIIGGLIDQFFPNQPDEISRVESKSLFHIARHMAQNDGEEPIFHPFADRGKYNLDVIARDHWNRNLSVRDISESLIAEYKRGDRYWVALYPKYVSFKTQYDACINRLQAVEPASPTVPIPAVLTTPEIEDEGPSDEVKNLVKSRDGIRCLCCGDVKRNWLQVDHILARYFGGSNDIENLQMLCRFCNTTKNTVTIDFRVHHGPSDGVTEGIPIGFGPAPYESAGDIDHCKRALRRFVNFHYAAAAVDTIAIGHNGHHVSHWTVHLFDGNSPSLIAPRLPQLVVEIHAVRKLAGQEVPKELRIVGPDGIETAEFPVT